MARLADESASGVKADNIGDVAVLVTRSDACGATRNALVRPSTCTRRQPARRARADTATRKGQAHEDREKQRRNCQSIQRTIQQLT